MKPGRGHRAFGAFPQSGQGTAEYELSFLRVFFQVGLKSALILTQTPFVLCSSAVIQTCQSLLHAIVPSDVLLYPVELHSVYQATKCHATSHSTASDCVAKRNERDMHRACKGRRQCENYPTIGH